MRSQHAKDQARWADRQIKRELAGLKRGKIKMNNIVYSNSPNEKRIRRAEKMAMEKRIRAKVADRERMNRQRAENSHWGSF